MRGLEVRCDNIVLIGTLSTPINLERLVLRLPQLDYSKGRFPAAIARFSEPRVTISIFATGSVTVAGVKCIYSAYYALNKLCELVRPHCPEARVGKLQQHNLTCSMDLRIGVDLARCARENAAIVNYTPQVFDGLNVTTRVQRITSTSSSTAAKCRPRAPRASRAPSGASRPCCRSTASTPSLPERKKARRGVPPCFLRYRTPIFNRPEKSLSTPHGDPGKIF